MPHVSWSRNANIYEVNIRQYTPGGYVQGVRAALAAPEKDPIQWKGHAYVPFYTRLLALKHANPALWNGQYGGPVQVLATGNDKVFAFRRTLQGNSVRVTVNVSNAAQRFTLPGGKPQTLAAWDYRIDAPVNAAAR